MSGVFSTLLLMVVIIADYAGSGCSTPRSVLAKGIICRKRTLRLHKGRTIQLFLCRHNCRGRSPVRIFMGRSKTCSTYLFSNRCRLVAGDNGNP